MILISLQAELLEAREMLTSLVDGTDSLYIDTLYATEDDYIADALDPINADSDPVTILDNYIPGWGWPQPDGLGSAITITYSYSNLFDGGMLGVDETYMRAAIEEAFGIWATYAPLNFVEMDDSGPVVNDSDYYPSYPASNYPQIRFGHHDLTSNSGGNVLAHAYYSWDQSYGLSGDIHFDNKDTWADGPYGGYDFLEVAVHEIGHALSIMHEDSNPAMMNPYIQSRYSGLGTAFLFQDDIDAIQGMYGAGVGSVVSMGNKAPIFDLIVDQSVSHGTDTFAVDISATDAEGDPITYSAAIVAQSGVDLGTVSLNGTTLTIDPADGYVGTYQVTVSASDGEKTGTRTFNVSVTNDAPLISLSDQTMSPLEDTLILTLSGTDADGDAITYSASLLESVERQAYQYDTTYGLYVNQIDVDNNYWQNIFGENAKHIRGTDDSYYLLSNGDFYEFNGSMDASTYIGTLDSSYYADPSKLYNAPVVNGLGFSVSVSGDQLTLDPPDGYTGTFRVAVTASDFGLSTTQSFTVTVVNQTPVLTAVSDQTMSHTTDTTTLTLSATDPESEAITYSASIVPQSGVTIGTVSVSGNTLTIDPDLSYAGTFQVVATASDGYSSGTTTFNVTVTNNTPTITPTSDATLSPTGGALTFDIIASDLDGDTLTYSATASSLETSQAYDLDQQYNLFALQRDIDSNYWYNMFGAGEKNFRGDGGSYYLLSNGDLYRFNNSIADSIYLATLDSSYFADPSLLYNAPAPAGLNMSMSFTGSQLSVTPPNGFTGTFEVVVTVSDGVVSATDTFQVTIQNQSPVLDAVGDKTMARSTDTIDAVLSATDADGDTITYTASIVPQSGVTIGSLSVIGNTLTVNPDLDYSGTFQVSITADDGFQSDTKTFNVTVTNNTPTIAAIGDMAVSPTGDPILVTVDATDSDGDSLTYSATASSLESSPAYDLDQQYNLFALQRDIDSNYWYNMFGAGEKNFRGDGGSYFLLSNGDLYQFSNSIADSIYLATLDSSYYADPSLLYDAPAPIGQNISATFTGNQLTLTPPNGFTGTFEVVVTVSDGAISTTETFEVSIQNQIPVLSAISDRTISRGTDSFDIVLSGSDPDGDPLAYTASITPQSGVTIGTVSVTGNTLTVNPDDSFEGTFQVNVTVSDGYQSDTKTFDVTVTNQSPTITVIDDTNMSPAADTLVMTIDASDADGDSLTYSATAASLESNPAYDLDQQYNLYSTLNDINNNYWHNLFGSGEKHIRGDNGSYYITSNGELYFFGGSIAASTYLTTVDTQYYDDPSLLYDAEAPEGASIPVSFSGNQLTVDPPLGFVGTFQVTVSVSDGAVTTTEIFNVTIQNQAPVLATVSDQTMARTTDSIDVALSATDADGDAITYTASIVPQSGVLIGAVSVNGSTLTVNPDANYAGTFQVVVIASDGYITDTETFNVTVTNEIPTFIDVTDQTMLNSDGSLVVNLDASDADGDTLTYTATASGTGSDPAWNLKEQHGLYATQNDINAGGYFDLFGMEEKHIRGADGSYFILSNGDFYKFNGSMADSTFMQTVDSAYFDDLSLIYDAQAPVGPVITATVIGNQLTLMPPFDYTGTFTVDVTVSDGASSVTQTFTVTVSAGMIVSSSSMVVSESSTSTSTTETSDTDSATLDSGSLTESSSTSDSDSLTTDTNEEDSTSTNLDSSMDDQFFSSLSSDTTLDEI